VDLHNVGYDGDSQTLHRGALQDISKYCFFLNLCVLFFQMAIKLLGQIVIK
jgi:hypothetical protein